MKKSKYLIKVISILLTLCMLTTVASAVELKTPVGMTEAEYDEIFKSLDIPSFINEDNAREAKHVERLSEYEESYDKIGYKNADGTKTLYMFSSPVKYMDEDGRLKDADPNITETADTLKQSGYSHKNEFGKLKTYFADSLSNDKGVKIELNDDSIEFGFSIAEKKQNILQKAVSIFEKPQNKASVTSENRVQKLEHLKVDNQNNIITLPTMDGAVQTFVLKEAPENNKVTFWVKTEDTTPTVDSSNKSVVFSADQTDFSIAVSDVKDSNGLISTDNTVRVVSTQNESALVEVTLDQNVVQNPDAEYPVSVTLNAKALSRPIGSFEPPDFDYSYFEDTTLYTNGVTEVSEAEYLIVGQAGSNSVHGRAFLRYDTDMLEGIDPKFIYDAQLLLVEASGNSSQMQVNLARVTSEWLEDVVDPYMYYSYDTTYGGNNDIIMSDSGTEYFYEIDITQLFTDHMLYEQGFGGGVPNYGFQLYADASYEFGKHICSSEHGFMWLRPVVSIRYEDPNEYLGYTTHDYINRADPVDWYSFTPADTSIYDIYTSNYTVNGVEHCTDVRAFLYDSELNLLAQDDDSGESVNFKISYELQANETYYLKVQGQGSATTGYYYLTIEHPDPFHHSNIDYVRIKKYDQSSWGGDYDITTIVTKSLKNQSSYFEAFAPGRTNISFLITQEVIDTLNTQENNYLNYPTLHLASVYFHLAKNAVDEMVEANVIDSESPEYYGIWVYEANRLISTTQYVAEQIELSLAAVTVAYNVYRSVTNYYLTLSSSNNTTTVVSYDNYSSIVKCLDDIDDSIGSNVTSKKVLSAEVRNSILADTGYTNPPYKPGTPVVEFKHTSSTQYIRVYTEGITSPQGKWLMKYNDIAGLTPSQIQAKFALPNTPTHYVTVNVPSEINMCSGFVGPNYGYTQNLGIQFELLQTIDNYLFINPTPIN